MLSKPHFTHVLSVHAKFNSIDTVLFQTPRNYSKKNIIGKMSEDSIVYKICMNLSVATFQEAMFYFYWLNRDTYTARKNITNGNQKRAGFKRPCRQSTCFKHCWVYSRGKRSTLSSHGKVFKRFSFYLHYLMTWVVFLFTFFIRARKAVGLTPDPCSWRLTVPSDYKRVGKKSAAVFAHTHLCTIICPRLEEH